MPGRVLVTRPQPAAARTAQRLIDAGFTPILLPLSETVPLPVEAEPPASIDAVAVTSANALRHLPKSWRDRLSQTRLFAVGEETARVARDTGFVSVTEGPGDARGLATRVAHDIADHGSVLYVCGRVRLPDFENALASANRHFAVLNTEIYDTRAITYDREALAETLGSEPIMAVLLYSREAARAYREAVSEKQLPVLQLTRNLCLSKRVASVIDCLGLSSPEVAAEPTEDALFAMLGGHSEAQPRPGLFSA